MKTLSEVASEIELSNARIMRSAAEMMLGTIELFRDQQTIIADQARQIADLKKQNAELSQFINTHYELEESRSDLGKAIKGKIEADFPSMEKIKRNIEKQMKGA